MQQSLNRTELHRHLDASIRPATLAELNIRLALDLPYKTEAQVREDFWLTRQMGSLKEVLDRFVAFQKVLATPEVAERLAFEALEDCLEEGVGWVELRYSPSFASELSGLRWDDILSAFQRGLANCRAKFAARQGIQPETIHTGLLCIVSRDYGAKMAEQTIDFAIDHRDAFVGVDLAGNEMGIPCELFRNAFQRAAAAGLPATIHAGEASGPENIWQAIDELGAKRIGHGVSAVQDKTLLRRLARDQILVEVCPTSNVITRAVESLKKHPLPRLLDAGIPACLNTDDPGIFGVSLSQERSRVAQALGLSESDFQTMDQMARKFSFISSAPESD